MITRFTEVQMIPKGGSIPVKNLADDIDVVAKMNKMSWVQYRINKKTNRIERIN